MLPSITIVGLGPGNREHWTRAAYTVLTEADEIYVRRTGYLSGFEIEGKIYTFDSIYQDNSDLTQIYNEIAAAVVKLGQRPSGVTYATPGHPNLDDPTTPLIRAEAAAQNIPVTVIPGLSLADASLKTLKLDLTNSLQIASAQKIAPLHHPPFNPDQAALIMGLSSQNLAARVKQVLLNAYADSFTVTLVHFTNAVKEHHWFCPLADLDQQPGYDEMTVLYLPADAANSSFPTFQETIAYLRAPEGCPWDREQTHQTLRPFLLEETYEVLEALDGGNPAALAEELGDLLLQIVLHAQIATGAGDFRMGEVIGHIQRKLIRRHPHVFGTASVNGAEEVTINWEAIKKVERERLNVEGSTIPSALDGIPAALPALAQALTISKRAVRVGFEWPNIEGVLDKLIEEAREITIATDPANLEAEIGDLLFSAVNLARWRQVDPESALRATNARFTRRFKKLESLAAAQNKSLPELTIEELEALWQEAKGLVG